MHEGSRSTHETARVKVVSSEAMPEDARLATARWVHEMFGSDEDRFVWAKVRHHVLVYVGNQLASHLAIVERNATAGGEPVQLAGIGGVMTPPEWRGKRLASAAMHKAEAFMRDKLRAEFGLLLCSEELMTFYERLGWQRVAHPVYFHQPSGRIQWNERAMVLPCTARAWPEGEVDLCGLPW